MVLPRLGIYCNCAHLLAMTQRGHVMRHDAITGINTLPDGQQFTDTLAQRHLHQRQPVAIKPENIRPALVKQHGRVRYGRDTVQAAPGQVCLRHLSRPDPGTC